ncbi:IMPACT family protein [Halodesulfurarchaeum sp.]|uniref:IMPACT family protein n=1 Tax=Halodesulfurarchaeum sp. TaxID=1980530 RepID=UPI001BB8B08C|nr:YigZ family protein [Halodesulfurarchaeum sp.]
MTDPDGEPEPYLTVAGEGGSYFEIRGSEFTGHVAPARSKAAAEDYINSVRGEFSGATVIPAYRVRVDSGSGYILREYQDDHYEPTGSAGKPSLNVLVQQDLENVVAVVARYYGGTNLGIGGLARAFSRGVKEAVEDAGVTEARPEKTFGIEVAYDDSGTVRGILESEGVDFEGDYQERVSFTVTVPVGDAASLKDRIRSATSGRAEIEADT